MPPLATNRTAQLHRGLGILHSVATVYLRPGQQKRLGHFYQAFVGADDLVFDIGAHVGGQTRVFARLGARVVALEPQPHLHAWLRYLIGSRPGVIILGEAVGAEAGTADLAISRSTPTASSMSADWRRTVEHGRSGNRPMRWEDTAAVPVTTLDRLIDQYGVPAFCRIDAEGYEAQVLSGLSNPIPTVSMAFMPNAMEVAKACVDRLSHLAPYEFNVIYGDHQCFTLAQWKCAEAIKGWLDSDAGSALSGDLYARIPN